MKETITHTLDNFFTELKVSESKLEIVISNGKIRLFGMGTNLISLTKDLDKLDFKIHNMVFIHKERYAINRLEILYK